MPLTRADYEKRIDQAAGRVPADLVIKNVRILDTASGVIRDGEIAIGGDTVVGTFETYQGVDEIDAGGRVAMPGFIDAHLHIESSMVTPAEFEKVALPRGTTTAVCDPHEIANVLGLDGICFFLESALRMAMTLRVNLSSCVPATDLETSGARLEAADLMSVATHPAVLGLAEVMNFPGVIMKDEGLLAKLVAFQDRPIDGHAPLLRGRDLNAYLASGIGSDHECTLYDEAAEKLAKGMHIFLREGSVAKNVAALAPLVTDATWMRCAFCTDDRNPLEIIEDGHIDYALRKAIRNGAAPVPALRAATLGAALAFGLTDRGIIAPGKRADIVLLDDVHEVAVERVICGGQLVEASLFEGQNPPQPVGYGSVKRAEVRAGDFAMRADRNQLDVIGVTEGAIITDHLQATPSCVDGAWQADPAEDLLKLAVLERHGVNGNKGLGFVKGFGAISGAIGVSVGHDSHNLIIVGSNDDEMALAANRLIELQGGAVVAAQGRIKAELGLPIAGLMSDRSFEEVTDDLRSIREAGRAIGCKLPEPILQLSFLALPVIPHLKLTDRGLVAATETGLSLLAD
ncbi:MAG: adenine deaminase [Pseudomonadota bacterium]